MYDSGVGGAATTLGGVSVLPFTNGNPLLLTLAIAVIAFGAIVLLSFVVTRVLRAYYSKS